MPESCLALFLFFLRVAVWTSQLCLPLSDVQSHMTDLVAPAVWKEGWPKRCLRKGGEPFIQLCCCIYSVDALDYSDSLPKTGKVTKIRLKEGINHPIIWGYPYLRSHHCGSIPVSIFVPQSPRGACLCLSLEVFLYRCLQKVKPGTCESDSYSSFLHDLHH